MEEPVSTWSLADIAGIATAVSVTVTLLLQLVWRFFDARRAVWENFGGFSVWAEKDGFGNDQAPHVSATFTNVGDGDGLAVRITGLGCRVFISEARLRSHQGRYRDAEGSLLPRVEPGDEIDFLAYCEPSQWDVATIAITWTTSPARLRRLSRRVALISLSDVGPRPHLVRRGTDPTTAKPTQQPLPEPQEPVLQLQHQAQNPAAPPKRKTLQRNRLRRELKRR